MSRIKRMVAQHIKRFFGHPVFDHVVNVFIVPPGKVHLIKASPLLVHPQAGVQLWVVDVGIGGEEFAKNDLVRKGASDRKSVSHDGPLRLTVQAKNLAEIMDEPGEDEPAGVTVPTDLFRGLEQVLKL